MRELHPLYYVRAYEPQVCPKCGTKDIKLDPRSYGKDLYHGVCNNKDCKWGGKDPHCSGLWLGYEFMLQVDTIAQAAGYTSSLESIDSYE